MTGRATAKLLVTSVVLVIGTNSGPGASGPQVSLDSNNRDC